MAVKANVCSGFVYVTYMSYMYNVGRILAEILLADLGMIYYTIVSKTSEAIRCY